MSTHTHQDSMMQLMLCARVESACAKEGLTPKSWSGLSLGRAEHQVIQTSFEPSTPFFYHLLPNRSVFDSAIRERCAQSPYPIRWQITDFIMHLRIKSVMPLDFIGTTCWKQCHEISPVLIVGVLLRTLFNPLHINTCRNYFLSQLQKEVCLEELVCFHLKETVNLKVIKVAFER